MAVDFICITRVNDKERIISTEGIDYIESDTAGNALLAYGDGRIIETHTPFAEIKQQMGFQKKTKWSVRDYLEEARAIERDYNKAYGPAFSFRVEEILGGYVWMTCHSAGRTVRGQCKNTPLQLRTLAADLVLQVGNE